MKLLLLLAFAGGILAIPTDKRLGCDTNPCEHQCIDTIDSYYCQCFKNWQLQPDGHSCLQLAQKDYDAAYLGCWGDEGTVRDLPYHIWTRPEDANVPQCLHGCRSRGFRYAGLQKGNECWCGNSYERVNYDNGTCDMPCPGSNSQFCGGQTSNSIYKVTRDSRYVGCFYENTGDRDLPVILWGVTDGRSVDECNIECARQGYLFSGVYNGGQCACGNDYGKHGLAGEEYCMVRCRDGYALQNCGGNSSNAVYRTMKGRDMSGYDDKMVSEGLRATLPVDEVYLYPHQLGMYTKRMVLYASDSVNNVRDDITCTEDCYSLCGTIEKPEGFDKYREDVVVRAFHLKISELLSHIEFPETAQRVWVFAQTLYIDQSVTFDFSLYLRARQVIINYALAPTITFNHEGPELGLNIDEAIYRGAPSDLTFQKQSLLCARMLMNSEDDNNNRLAWAIVDDMARDTYYCEEGNDRVYCDEQKHFLNHIKGVRAEMSSIGRNDVHWSPYFTQTYYVNTLDIYSQQMTLYSNTYDDLLDDAIECSTFKERAETLITIWTTAIVNQARILKEHADDNLAQSEATYQRMYLEYNESRKELEVAAEEFKKGLEEWKDEQVRKAMFGFIGSAIKLAFGVFPCGAAGVAKDLKDAVDGVILGLELLEVTMENLAKTMEELEAFLNITDEIIATKDYERYMENVEAVAGLYVIIPEWANFKYQTDVIFREEEFRNIGGAIAFSFAIFDLCNWGEALTRSMVEFATNIRIAVTFDSLYENRVEMQERYEAYFEQVGAECEQKEKMVIAFAEQHYDITLDMNNQLIQFCEAHYYERMKVCPEGTRPNFAYNIDDLLIIVNQAKLTAESLGRKSSAVIDFDIVDDEDAWDNCTDRKICPMKMFLETGKMYFELPTDHRRFIGIDLFLVDEIQLYLPGAVSVNGSTDLRFLISSTGPFKNRLDEEEAVFMTRALSEMKFQYDIETRNIELRADLYKTSAGSSMIKHMTPFTTWLIEKDPEWTHIDISGAGNLQMLLKGPFESYYDEEENEPVKPRLA